MIINGVAIAGTLTGLWLAFRKPKKEKNLVNIVECIMEKINLKHTKPSMIKIIKSKRINSCGAGILFFSKSKNSYVFF